MLHRHAPDVVSLVFGILFAGFAAIWLLSETDVIDNDGAWLAGPVTLIVAGVFGLAVALRPSRVSEPQPAPPWAAPPAGRTTEPEPTVRLDHPQDDDPGHPAG